MIKRNIIIYYLLSFLGSLIFTTPIWSFFFTSYLNFSFGIALFIILLSSIISTIFEVPSGAWADRYGRKKMYIVGSLLVIISSSFWLFSKELYLFIISGILGGIGYAILSGNLTAIIHDTLEINGKDKDFDKVESNSYTFLFIGRALASLLAGYLFVINPLLPIILTLGILIIELLIFTIIKEPKQILSKHNDNITHIKSSLKYLNKNINIKFIIIILSIISGLGNIYWFTYQPFLNNIGYKIEYIGILFALTGIISSIGPIIYKKIIDFAKINGVIVLIIILFFLGSLSFALFDKSFAIVGIILSSIAFGMIMTSGNSYLMKHCKKSEKSTLLSIFGLSMALSYTSLSLISGYIVDKIGLQNLYYINISLIGTLFIFTLIFIKRKGNLL